MGKFFKTALFVDETRNLEDLYDVNHNAFHHVVAMKDENPKAAIGLAWKDKDKHHIYIDPEGPPEKQRSVERHELVHAIRDHKGLTSAKWSDLKTPGLKKGIGTFIEELAATRAGSYSRTLKDAPLGQKINNSYIYAIESGLGGLTGNYHRFDKLRKLLHK